MPVIPGGLTSTYGYASGLPLSSSLSSIGGAFGLGSIAGIGLNIGSALASGNTGQIVGTVGGTAAGAGIGAAIGSIVPGVGTAVGALFGGSLGSSVGGMFGKGEEDDGIPEAQANQMNVDFMSKTANFTNYYSAVQSSSTTIPLLLAYAGYNGKQIWDFQMQQQMNLYNQSYAIGMEVSNHPPARIAQNNTTAQIQANVAQLYQTPSSTYDNLVTLTQPLDPTKDYRQPG